MGRSPYYDKGVYRGRIERQELGQSSTDKPQFALTCTILEGLDSVGGRVELERQYERTVYMYLTPAAMEITLKSLAVLGFTKSSVKYLDSGTPGYSDFTGREVELFCNHEEWKGETREKWSVNTPREGKEQQSPTRISEATMREIDTLFAAGFRALSKMKSDLIEAASDIEGDDVPF